MIAPLTINMYLPALPAIAGAFGVEVTRIQLSVGLFLLGLGLGQFLGAPISDRYGRRPTALAGTAIVILFTSAILLCRSADQFIMLRLAQGVGAGLAIVNIGAVVGDLFDTQEAARTLSVIGLIQAVARLAAPVLGALLLAGLGWKSIFHGLVLYCAGLVVLLWLRLPETVVPATSGRDQSLLRSGVRSYGRVFRLTRALGYAVCLSFSTGCLFVYLTDAAFIYMAWFDLGPSAFSGVLALNVSAVALFTALNFGLLRRHAAHRIVPVACAAQCVTTGLLLAHVTLMTPSLPVVIVLVMASMGVAGLIIGNAGACFLAYFPGIRGTASGVAGSTQFVVGGALGTGLGIVHSGTLATTGLVVTGSSLAAALALVFAKPVADGTDP